MYNTHTHTHRIAQNSGGGKLWRIWQIELHSPIFYPAKITYRMARKFYMELNFTVLRLLAEP